MTESMGGERPPAGTARVEGPVAAIGLGRPKLDLKVVTSTAGLDALRSKWSDLHLRTGASVFQSYEWQRTWWAHFGENVNSRSLHIVVLEAEGEVVAIAPFVVEAIPIAPMLGLRRLVFLGTGMSDYLDLLVRTGLEAACCARIAAHLAQQASSFDMLLLSDIPDRSATRSHLFDALCAHGFEGRTLVVEQCPRTLLKDTWKETLESFGGIRRRHLIKRMRQMRERFRVELEVSRTFDRVEADIEQFMEMHQQRWTSAGKKGVFAEPTVAAFQRAVARAFFDRGWLFLTFLRLDGERVAAACNFRHRDEVSFYLSGLRNSGEALKYSPGLVLHCLCMEELVPQGVRVFDFLRGSVRYKYQFGAVDVPNWALLMFRSGARAAKAKNFVALLEESLRRRLERERIAFLHQRRTHGLVSAGLARHLWSRLPANWRDGLRKLRAPEKPLQAPE